MSFKEIKELRQAGKLDEALAMALQALEADFGNIWNKRAAAWVYYDFLKQNSTPSGFDSFKENLIKIKELQLPDDEHMVFDSCAWQIGSLVFSLNKEIHIDFKKIDELFEIIISFHFSKPADGYSFLYKAFHKGNKEWNSYLKFADWWNFENFQTDDYLEETYKGRNLMALAEQAYIAYAKKLLQGVKPSDKATAPGFLPPPAFAVNNTAVRDLNKIRTFLPKLSALIEKYPNYKYPAYYHAKLLMELGEKDNSLSAFLPFARQKSKEFWVWELLAEIFSDNDDVHFSCHCKALSLNSPEDFVIKLRQNFAAILIKKKMYNEAKTEIEKVVATRTKHEWKIPTQITQWMESDWFKAAVTSKDNKELFTKHASKAEEILYSDIPEEIIAVEFVNENKNMLNFVKGKTKSGFFNYNGKLIKPQIGEVLSVRFSDSGQDGFFKVLTANRAQTGIAVESIKSFENSVKVITPHNFGFVEDVFIEPRLINSKSISDGQTIKGKAILSFNKKKNEWGWKAFQIDL
jgi:hypothetical protein